MSPQTILFIGRSGCGKGTQAKLFIDYLNTHDTSGRQVFYLESGDEFRRFLMGQNYSNKLARDVARGGGLQPSFLAVHIWSHIMIEKMTGNEHLIIDGTPRTHSEAQVLDTAISFYKRENPIVFHIDVSNEWSREKLIGRGRKDDISAESINKRLEWFDTDVVPALRHMQTSNLYKVIEINGEQSIEEVQHDIVAQFEKLI